MVKKTFDAKARLALKISQAKMWWRFEEIMRDGCSYGGLKDFYNYCRKRGLSRV